MAKIKSVSEKQDAESLTKYPFNHVAHCLGLDSKIFPLLLLFETCVKVLKAS